VTLTRYRPTP